MNRIRNIFGTQIKKIGNINQKKEIKIIRKKNNIIEKSQKQRYNYR